jgi:general stress protein 26
MSGPRPSDVRKADALATLASEADAWVATADRRGHPHLVPLSIGWDGEELFMVTERTSRTVRNLADGGGVRVALGGTRDVVVLDGSAEVVEMAGVDQATVERYVAQAGWDPRPLDGNWVVVRVRPRRIQAWREADEIEGRALMGGGTWLV